MLTMSLEVAVAIRETIARFVYACDAKEAEAQVKWLHHAYEKTSLWILPSWASQSCKIAAVAC